MKQTTISRHVHGRRSSRQLSPGTWSEFEEFFAANGGVWGGCWCMFYQSQGGFEPKDYEGNRGAKRALVFDGRAHGTLVYCGNDAVGWCQFGPKDELPRVDRKRGYVATSPDPWRITCLFIERAHRNIGFSEFAVKESVSAIKKLRAKTIEAYPVEGEKTASFLWSGTPGVFESAGFSRVGPLGKKSWVYSLDIGGTLS